MIQNIRFLITVTCVLACLAVAEAKESSLLPPLNDPPNSSKLLGKFVWFDFATPEMKSQQAFYQDVFGWTYRSPAPTQDDYVLILNNGTPIGGMFNATPPGGEQDGATWLALFSVDNVDRTVDIAKSSGGRVEVAAATMAQRGRYALLRDPADAVFGVIDSSTGDPADVQVPIGGILWVDLFARDVEAMAGFYGKLAPWDIAPREIPGGIDGRLLTANGSPRAGIVTVDEEANRSAWVPYVRVDDVQATLDRAVEGGGFLIVAPDPDLRDGNLGIFVDPHGGVTGVVKYEYAESGNP